jgi:hypothetical protein
MTTKQLFRPGTVLHLSSLSSEFEAQLIDAGRSVSYSGKFSAPFAIPTPEGTVYLTNFTDFEHYPNTDRTEIIGFVSTHKDGRDAQKVNITFDFRRGHRSGYIFFP